MASNVHTLVTQAQEVTSKGLGDVRAPVQIPNGTTQKGPSTPKVRSKYRHVAALHSKVRPSCLSHEAPETPSFIGFRNLMVLTIIVMNLRLVVENAKKYGLLITLKLNLQKHDVTTALILYSLTPCHLFVA